MNRSIIPLVVFIVLVGFLYVGLDLNPRKIPSVLIEKPVPEFSLPRLLDPNSKMTNEDLLGKISLFNAWGTWCPSCYQEHPALIEIARKYKIPIYGLNYKDVREDAIRWLNKLGNPYVDIAFDQDGRSSIDWGIYAAPETFIVDKKGIIRHKHIGPIDLDIFTNELLPIINDLDKEL